jgi:hypothetical protein
MHKVVSILIAILFFCTSLMAQEKKYVYSDSSLLNPPDETVSYDSVIAPPVTDEQADEATKENVVEIDTALRYTSYIVPKDTVDAWKQDKKFAYTQYLDSLLKAQQRNQKKQQEINQTPSSPSWLDRLFSSNGLQYFLWFVAGAFILFILYNLFLAEGVFKRAPKSAAAAAPDAEEELIDHESDFDKLIRSAIQSGNYRLAVRYHYLQTLHLLAGKNQVRLAADKTNYQYVNEIVNKNYQNDFAGLTLNYEYVWYGEFAIEELIYGKLKTAFISFNNKL